MGYTHFSCFWPLFQKSVKIMSADFALVWPIFMNALYEKKQIMGKQTTNPRMVGRLHKWVRPKNYRRLVVKNERKLVDRVISVKSCDRFGEYVRVIVRDENMSIQDESGENLIVEKEIQFRPGQPLSSCDCSCFHNNSVIQCWCFSLNRFFFHDNEPPVHDKKPQMTKKAEVW